MPKLIGKPQLVNMVVGGKMVIFNATSSANWATAFVLYANAELQSAVAGMQ